MKFLLVLSAILAMAIAYSEIDDTKDIELVIGNPEGVKATVDCLLDNGPCDELIGAIKKLLPEIIKTECANCSTTQKHTLRRILHETSKQKSENLQDLGKKYDPEDKYFNDFIDYIADF